MISAISSYMDPSLMTAVSTQTQKAKPFDAADTNGDGFLDSTELAAVAEKISKMSGETVTADQMMADLDSDGDGKLSEEEFKAGRPEGPPPPPGGMMGMMGSGMEGGVKSLLDILNESDDEDSSSTDSLDLNGDGVVDAQEALLGIQNLIQKYLGDLVGVSGEDGGNQVNLSV